MNCQDCREQMTRQPGRCSEAIQAHLLDCEDCAAELIGLLRFERVLYEALHIQPAAGLEARIQQMIATSA